MQATISNTTFQANSADYGGAAFLDVNTTLNIEDSRFIANHAFTNGGGISLNIGSASNATGCRFDKNNASYGAGLYCDGCSLQASRLSFTHNKAVNSGGGLFAWEQAQVIS